VGQRTGVINQIRGFLIKRGITVRQGVAPLRKALPDILSSNPDALSPRMVNLIAELVQEWRRLDERIAAVSAEIEALAQQDEGCQRVMTVPGAGPIIFELAGRGRDDNTSDVAVCCSSASARCSRASLSSRLYVSSCRSRSLRGLRI
jgi:transposase